MSAEFPPKNPLSPKLEESNRRWEEFRKAARELGYKKDIPTPDELYRYFDIAKSLLPNSERVMPVNSDFTPRLNFENKST